ncbi:MAG: type I-C CRISPR-associated protein Cas8c/Csd1 [Oscillospiraceae bacterium]|nr:type I-C CRISPR-associated protein Cas8c/Csd1 [Oscillospiraceae bacterium]
MNWFNNLLVTYESVLDIVGKPDQNGSVLLPTNHMLKNTDIHLSIDGEGKFKHAEHDKKEIIIPCTEDSQSRSGKVVSPHPLHEELGYLYYDDTKREAYFNQLEAWYNYHPKVEAVYKYLLENTIIEDLRKSGIIDGESSPETVSKQFVRFSVEILGDLNPNIWEDKSIFLAWNNYVTNNNICASSLCYVTGKTGKIMMKHPKRIVRSSANAKLISSNDKNNYTYRGRFTRPEQANAINAESSWKAHAMLAYLISTQGYKCDTQEIVAWSINTGQAALNPFEETTRLFNDESVITNSDVIIEAQGGLAIDYAKKLRKAFLGMGNSQDLTNHINPIAVIAIDVATTGRMSVTFYQDMPENDYINRVIHWHETCCWWFRDNGKDYISAPSTDKIIEAVYGEPKGDGYNKIKKQARERMLHLIINGEKLNRAWLNAARNRVSNPFSYNKIDGGWDKRAWESAINITCAITKKYYVDNKEVVSLELENRRCDRDYLYGRLLAIADKIESHARYLQTGKNDTEKRPTNAIRLMSAFSAKPFRTWSLIYNQLSPYIIRLNGAEGYQKRIDEIMSLFYNGEFESDKPLNGKYLMGYSLQRRALNQNNNMEVIRDELDEKD